MDDQSQVGQDTPDRLPTRLPFAIEAENRDDTTSKDARLVNCYLEKGKDGGIHLQKRPGILVQSSLTAAAGSGIFNWNGDIYSIFGTVFYKNGVNTGTVDGTNGVYRFDNTLGGTPKLQLGNGVKAYNYDAGAGLVQITDGDFPSAFVKGWSYLDQTTYVMTAAAAIQGDDINDPTSWDPLNTLTAQIDSDGGVALAKQLVYVVAFKQFSTEIFYDAGNATGSPLGAVQGAKVNWGCLSADGVQDVGGALLWPGTNKTGVVEVVMMEGLKAEPVSTKAISRLLEGSTFASVYSWQLKQEGHKFYVLTCVDINLTLAFDTKERLWHQWTDANGNYFPIAASTYSSTRQPLLQHVSNGKIYTASPSYLTDDGSLITVDIYTPNLDGGTKRKKHIKLMEFVGDQVPGSTLQVRTSDDDYQSWTNFRTVDMGQKRPMLTDCGTFRRRAHNIRHRANTTLRLQAVELQMDLGTL